jgi:hypothetical protein
LLETLEKIMGKRVTVYERIMQDRMIQGLLDDIRDEVPPEVALRGNAKTNPHRARVAEFFKAHGFPNAYATSFWMAFAQGIPFDRGLHNRFE